MSEYLDPTMTNEIEIFEASGHKVKPGDMVELVGDHPHAGRVGIYKGVDVLFSGRAAALVKFADGSGCYVFNAGQWRLLIAKRGVK